MSLLLKTFFPKLLYFLRHLSFHSSGTSSSFSYCYTHLSIIIFQCIQPQLLYVCRGHIDLFLYGKFFFIYLGFMSSIISLLGYQAFPQSTCTKQNSLHHHSQMIFSLWFSAKELGADPTL